MVVKGSCWKYLFNITWYMCLYFVFIYYNMVRSYILIYSRLYEWLINYGLLNIYVKLYFWVSQIDI